MNIIKLVTLGSLLTLSSFSQAGQSVHIGNLSISNSNGLSIVNGRVISGSQDAVPGSGTLNTEIRTLDTFTEIRVRIAANVSVSKGDSSKCTIIADANILPLITTEVRNGVLTIANSKNFTSSTELSVQITTPNLTKLVMDGSGDADLSKVQEHTLELIINGSGNLRAEGQVETLIARINGSGDMDLLDLHAQYAEAVLAGAGTIQIFANKTFGGEIGGSGDITVHGHPRITRSVVNGAGRINTQ